MERNIGEPIDDWNISQIVGNLDSETMLDTQESAVKVEERSGNAENGNLFPNNNNNKRSSIAERRAAKCGFNASTISIAQFRVTTTSMPEMSPPTARPTFLTIPPGLTPAALLDSPVMLPNSLAPQSPTTGSFHFSTINQENTRNTTQIARDHFEFPVESPKATALKKCSLNIPRETNVQQNMSCIGLTNIHDSGNCTRKANQFEQRSAVTNNNITSNGSDDGYTWRKYGQKHVKGSEFPRSYYKCTQQNCPVKKKVERSPDGQITEIVYKGAHNHHKSQPPRRGTMSSTSYGLGEMSEMNEGNIGGSNSWRSVQFERNKDVRAPSTSSASVLTEASDPLMLNYQNTNMNAFESATPEPSSTLASHDDEDEDRGSTSLGDDVDDYAFDHKRRRREFYSSETSLSSRTAREPRVVVQIESEIDILDDGYRWRKYGQKVVKGNPNPRSYYKCTSAGCPVRKHVERAPDNLKSVITTYEGKHNHEVPSANRINCAISGNQALTSTSKTNKVSNSGMQVQDCNFQFNRKPFDYVRPSFLDLRFGANSPIYDLKFPPNLHSPLSYGSFLLSPTQVSHSRSFTPLQMTGFQLPLSLPMSLPLVDPNIEPPLGGFYFNDIPLTPNGEPSHSSIAVADQTYIHDNNNDNNNSNKNSKLVKGNEEVKNENLYDHQNGASFCGQIMDNFPS